VEILNAADEVLGDATPANDTVVSLDTPIRAQSAAAEYRVRLTAKAHADMPAPPGTNQPVTAHVVAISSPFQENYQDTPSATLTVDNLAPANVTFGLVTPDDKSIALAWTNPGGDFDSVVLVRSTAAISAVPTEGALYQAGNSLGGTTVRYVGGDTSHDDTQLTNGTSYYFKAFSRDACGNYSAGRATGPHVPSQSVVTLGDAAAEPEDATLCPGAAAVAVDAFTLKTSKNADTVTAVTVQLSTGGAARVQEVSIVDSTGQVYGTSSNPTGDSVTVDLTEDIPVTTTEEEYQVAVSPRATAALPAGLHTVTATVTDVTCTFAKTSSGDAASATVTIDRSGPSAPQWLTRSAADRSIDLAWGNPSTDFAKAVLVRATAPTTATFQDGTDYTVASAVAGGAVLYVGPAAQFTDPGVLNGTSYYYRVLAADACLNYSASPDSGALVPSAPTLAVGEGSDLESSIVCPGASAMLDAFSLQTSRGADAVTSVIVTLADGTAQALARVEIVSEDGATVFGEAENPAVDEVVIPLDTDIPVTTVAQEYRVRITAKSHAALTESVTVRAAVTSVTSSFTATYGDFISAAIDIDRTPPFEPTWIGQGSDQGTLTLSWELPSGDDFRDVLLVAGASPITDRPSDGTAYTVGQALGATSVRYVGALKTFADAAPAASYKLFARDSCGNYSNGVTTDPPSAVVVDTYELGGCGCQSGGVPVTGAPLLLALLALRRRTPRR